ncbi:unnamed protein product [Linum trigynum]|uniref:Uncharacterized protein n=1 Tax=Linum trigynum TaxID=586398 RepID=A0AAV2DVY7_9ROSI
MTSTAASPILPTRGKRSRPTIRLPLPEEDNKDDDDDYTGEVEDDDDDGGPMNAEESEPPLSPRRSSSTMETRAWSFHLWSFCYADGYLH